MVALPSVYTRSTCLQSRGIEVGVKNADSFDLTCFEDLWSISSVFLWHLTAKILSPSRRVSGRRPCQAISRSCRGCNPSTQENDLWASGRKHTPGKSLFRKAASKKSEHFMTVYWILNGGLCSLLVWSFLMFVNLFIRRPLPARGSAPWEGFWNHPNNNQNHNNGPSNRLGHV